MCENENEDVCGREKREREENLPLIIENSDFLLRSPNRYATVWTNGNDSFCFLLFPFSERHYNEMTRHHQFPVMQLPEGAQSLNNPKNVSSVASPSLTSSLINNNCLLTLREMMQQQQQYQLHQYHERQQQQYKKRENAEENENSKSQIISTPLSPNSSIKLSPKYHAEKHESESPFSIGRAESLCRENRNETGANCFKHVKSECQTTGRTVREELELSRSKIPKPGKVHNNYFKFSRRNVTCIMHAVHNELN